MMAKDPANRYQKPVEVAQALAPFVKPGAKGAKPEANAAAKSIFQAKTVLPDRSPGTAAKETHIAPGMIPEPIAAEKKHSARWDTLTGSMVSGIDPQTRAACLTTRRATPTHCATHCRRISARAL